MARPNRGVRAPPVLLLGPPGIGGRRSGAGEGLGPSSIFGLSWSSAMLPVLLVKMLAKLSGLSWRFKEGSPAPTVMPYQDPSVSCT